MATYGFFALFAAVEYDPFVYAYLAVVWAVSLGVLLVLAKVTYTANARYRLLPFVPAMLLAIVLNVCVYSTRSEIETVRAGAAENGQFAVSALNLLPHYTEALLKQPSGD